MKLIDEAASIAALRHCASSENTEVALARVDTITFDAPMFVGEVGNVSADVTFTSSRSIEVSCRVEAENLVTGEKRKTNVATLWYVPVKKVIEEEVGSEYGKTLRKRIVVGRDIAQVEGLTSMEIEQGLQRYEQQKLDRASKKEFLRRTPDLERRKLTTAQLVLPDDCNHLGNVIGGVVLKLIDNAAAIIAFRHCVSNAVTAKINALDFVRPISIGQIMEMDARLVYTSKRSMEIRTDVYAETPTTGDRYLAVTANLVFVGLNEHNKSIEVRQMIVPENEFLKAEYEEARSRHEMKLNLAKL